MCRVYGPSDLLAAYDEQLRGQAESDSAVETDYDGPLVRVHYRLAALSVIAASKA